MARLIDYAFGVHREAHVRGGGLPRLAIFLDEISLADQGKPSDAAVRLFTQCYQHGIIGAAISQRPAMVSRNVLGNTWERYVFSLAPEDVETLRSTHRWVLPGPLNPAGVPTWVEDPEAHHYLRSIKGKWFRGDENGVEVAAVEEVPVDAMPKGQGGPQELVSKDGEPDDAPGNDADDGARPMPKV